MSAPTLTTEQVDLSRDAACGLLDHRGGDFFRAGMLLPAVDAELIRGLVFAGLLTLRGGMVEATDQGRAVIR